MLRPGSASHAPPHVGVSAQRRRAAINPISAPPVPVLYRAPQTTVENPVPHFAKFARLLLALAPTACAAAPTTLHVGPGQTYATPSAAIADASDGDTILIAPGQYFDCATVPQNHLTIAGVGDAASVVLTDKTCQGKALLVTTGTNITVRNLTLTRARVPDGNGAGIRVEGPDLTVDGVDFINNQDGILQQCLRPRPLRWPLGPGAGRGEHVSPHPRRPRRQIPRPAHRGHRLRL
jgi:hypothetical protein